MGEEVGLDWKGFMRISNPLLTANHLTHRMRPSIWQLLGLDSNPSLRKSLAAKQVKMIRSYGLAASPVRLVLIHVRSTEIAKHPAIFVVLISVFFHHRNPENQVVNPCSHFQTDNSKDIQR